MPYSVPWPSILDKDPLLGVLAERMLAAGVHETQTSNFWELVWTQLKSESAFRLEVFHQNPVVEWRDGARSLLRIDTIITGFNIRDLRSVPLLIAEYKRLPLSVGNMELVERQIRRACDDYTKSPESPTNVCFAACIVGPYIRLYKQDDSGFWPLWGEDVDCHKASYRDVLGKDVGLEVYEMIKIIVNTASPVQLAPRKVMRPAPPLTSVTRTVPSTPATAGPSRFAPQFREPPPAAVYLKPEERFANIVIHYAQQMKLTNQDATAALATAGNVLRERGGLTNEQMLSELEKRFGID